MINTETVAEHEPSFNLFAPAFADSEVTASRAEIQPTPRLAMWFMISSLGLIVEPIAHGAWLFTAGGALLLLALASLDVTRLSRANAVEARREREAVFSLGAPNAVRIRLNNPTELALDVDLLDEAPDEFQTSSTVEFHFHLPPRATWEASYHTTPLKRGDYHFGALNLRARAGFGLVAWARRLSFGDGGVRVYPNMRDVRSLSLLTMRDQRSLGQRVRRAPLVGREFESLRDYQTGDEWRSLDWKATARRHRLTVRNYDVEHSQKLLMVLDLGRTMSTRMGTLSKADVAINAAVLLTAVAARNDDRVGMLAFADELIGYLPPSRGRGQAARLLEFLYPLEAVARESDYRRAFSEIVLRLRSRTLVIVFTDLVDVETSSQLIDQLRVLAGRHAVLVVALSDHELEACLERPVEGRDELYAATVASIMLEDRDQAVARLTERGVRVMKARPETLSVDLVNRYLQWKRAGGL